MSSLAQEIIARHAGRASVAPGEILFVDVDRVYLQDGNSPTIRNIFDRHGFDGVYDAGRIGVFFDHSVLPPNVEMANRLREAAGFCDRFGLRVFRAGTGISHVVAQEEGWFEPGTIVVGSDSHTCTGGAWQCLALGMGATDVAAAMVTGRAWLRVPETVGLEVAGLPGRHARAKDVLLHALATFGDDPFLYRSVEWCGAWVESLTSDSAATVANMAVEMGAKCAFLPPGPGREGLRPIGAGAAGHDAGLRLDVEGLPPFVARPHAPANAAPLAECRGITIQHVFVGTCTNGRIEDLAELAGVLAGRRVHPRVNLVVTPGSRTVYLQALQAGFVETILAAGGMITPPGCGACLGTQGPIPASGDRVLSTMNRNFLGRMGNREAEIFLASPLVAAHTAVLGEIPAEADLE